ncbi:hypothetical protein WMY93_015079 [Mugilogobius chulae]|uniref:C-type lectin domain-containing protein n=1 Tax=Mugilogobius chulae TaxID=88201 RepID=A0AAW0P0J8_9GOBI
MQRLSHSSLAFFHLYARISAHTASLLSQRCHLDLWSLSEAHWSGAELHSGIPASAAVELCPLLRQMCLSVSQYPIYYFINESKSWSEAQMFCRKYYTDLATVNHMRDLERLRAAAGGQTDVWTGLYQASDKLADRKWLWSQPDVEYKLETDWKIGEPTDGENENCAIIYRDGKWIDTGCEVLRVCFICHNVRDYVCVDVGQLMCLMFTGQ